jgi:hypothetical protein
MCALVLSLGGTGYAATQASSSPATDIRAPITWSHPTLVNGWVWGGYSTNTPGYYKDADGWVYLQGSVKGGNHPLAFILPAGYLPPHDLFFSIYAGGYHTGKLQITSAGHVDITDGNGNVNVKAFSSLDGIMFHP